MDRRQPLSAILHLVFYRRFTPYAAYSRLILAFCILLLAWNGAIAQVDAPAPIDITSTFSERKIGLDLAIFEDRSGQLGLEQVQASDIAAQFVPSSKESPGFGYTHSAYWARFSLNNVRPEAHTQNHAPLYLVLAYAQTDLAELWCNNANGQTILHQRAGDHVPRAEWPNRHREPVFTISAQANICWLRVQSSASIQFPLTLYNQQAYFDFRLDDNALQSLYFGGLLVMLVYNGLIAISTRSLIYSTYSLFLLTYGLFQCAFGGLGYALLWPNKIGFADSITPFLISCLGISSVVFALVLLDLRQSMPRWFKFGCFVSACFIFTLLLPWFISYSIAIRSVFIIAMLWAVFLLGSGITLSWRGVRVAKIYLTAWLVFIAGTLIIIGSRLGWLPINIFTANATQIGSALEFILLSFALGDRIKTTQAALLEAQKKITHTLIASEQELEQKVKQRTIQLESANEEILIAYNTAEAARQQAASALQELQTTQSQLIAAEKMASLGLLVSNVAHEINTPIGAVQSSGQTVYDSMQATLENMPKLLDSLGRENRALFLELIALARNTNTPLPSREERSITKKISAELEAHGIEGSLRKARLLVKLGVYQHINRYLPLLTSPDTDFILSVAAGVADVLTGTQNINVAAGRVARIVASLKQLAGNERTSATFEVQVYKTIESAIATMESKLLDVDVVRQYQDMSPLRCDPDALQQLWTHLISNALHASQHQGVIMIGLRAIDGQVEVRIADFGCGMNAQVRARAFEPFFTTRASGEGGGMGLSIAKNIVEAHHGSITLQTEPGLGTTVTVMLPHHPKNV